MQKLGWFGGYRSLTIIGNMTLLETIRLSCTIFELLSIISQTRNVGPIRHCEPPHATLPFTRCRYWWRRTPPVHRCPRRRRRRQRQRVTEGTAMAPWNGPKYENVTLPWPRPLKGQFVIPMLKHHLANQCTKFEVSSFSLSSDTLGRSKKIKWVTWP